MKGLYCHYLGKKCQFIIFLVGGALWDFFQSKKMCRGSKKGRKKKAQLGNRDSVNPCCVSQEIDTARHSILDQKPNRRKCHITKEGEGVDSNVSLAKERRVKEHGTTSLSQPQFRKQQL